MNKITPFLWYNDNLEEALNFYASVFKNAKIKYERRMPDGKLFTATFQLDNQEFMAINGGPAYSLSPAFSFFVSCKNQEEVDDLWEKLSEGGFKSQCGWVQDKYGLSWQVIPDKLMELLDDPDPARAQRVMGALLKMGKIIISELEEAAKG